MIASLAYVLNIPRCSLMSDWADFAEAMPRFAGQIERSRIKIKRHKVKKVPITVSVSKEDREKYMAMGGAVWFRKILAAAKNEVK